MLSVFSFNVDAEEKKIQVFSDGKKYSSVEDYKSQRANQGKLTRTKQAHLAHPRIEERSNNNEKVGYSKFSDRLRCCIDPLTGQEIWLYYVTDA